MKNQTKHTASPFLLVASLALAAVAPQAEAALISDGGFESGSPNSFWSEASTNFGTPLCLIGSCGGASATPHSGDWWAWFGGIPGVTESGSLSQTTAPIPLGTATLSFFLAIPNIDSPSDFLKVFMDSTEVFSINATATITSYTQQSVDISAFADGAPHVLSFQSTTISANGSVSNFFVDDVDIAAVPAAVPEPSTLALFGIAALGLAARRRAT